MSLLEAFFLGIFQGITEFLPVSSSGHLVLAEAYLGIEQEKVKEFDMVLHGGSLCALFVLFWSDIRALFFTTFFPHKAKKENRKLLLWLIFGTIPVGLVGIFFEDIFEQSRAPFFVAIFFIVSAVLFFVAEWGTKARLCKQGLKKSTEKITHRAVFIAAFFQIFALFPGISRSGTVTAAVMIAGISRKTATRFAFLLGIPVIGAAFSLGVIKIILGKTDFSLPVVAIVVGFFASAFASYFMAKFLLTFFRKNSLSSFGIYLLIFGSIILCMETL